MFQPYSRLAVLASMGLIILGAVAGSSLLARAEEAAKDNAYLPRKGMSVEDLQAFIERMQDAPASIHNRPGYAEGLKVAAEHILETDPKGAVRRFALVTLFDSLHQQADVEENVDADKRLSELAVKHAADEDKAVAKAAAFYALEQRVLKSDDLSQADLAKLLEEVRNTLDGQELAAQHLRIASATVHAINRVENDETASKQLTEFGKLFAASSEPQLARYGGKLQSKAGQKEEQNQWNGKVMEVAGTTADGAQFEIAQYKGKVVLVDFWATWCGPCRASLPALKETYAKYRKDGFEVIGVSLDRELADLAEFLDKDKLPWINVVGEMSGDSMKFPIAEKYSVRAIPTTFLVDKEGKIVGQNLHGKELEDKIEKLLNGKSGMAEK